jgi:molecular chaperone Hsp33
VLYRGIIKGRLLRFVFVDTTVLTHEATIHLNFDWFGQYISSQLIGITSILGSLEKDNTIATSVSLKASGPLGNLKTYYIDGKVVINGKQNDVSKIESLTDLIGKGTIDIFKTIDNENYVSSTRIQTGALSNDFSYFFQESEQIPTLVCLQPLFDTNGKLLSSYGLIVQTFPDSIDEDYQYLEQLSEKLKKVRYNGSYEDFFKLLGIEVEYEETTEIIYKCSCNRKRILSVLKMLEKNEVDDLYSEVICEKCGKKYLIKNTDICGK